MQVECIRIALELERAREREAGGHAGRHAVCQSVTHTHTHRDRQTDRKTDLLQLRQAKCPRIKRLHEVDESGFCVCV